MKRITSILILAASMSAIAQQPAATNSPAMTSLQQRYAAANAQQQLLYEKLHGITEFQQWLKTQEDIAKLQQEYQTMAQRPAPPAATPKPNPAPVSPPTPHKK